jgi:hypothetical protein
MAAPSYLINCLDFIWATVTLWRIIQLYAGRYRGMYEDKLQEIIQELII